MTMGCRLRGKWNIRDFVIGLALCVIGMIVTIDAWSDMLRIAWRDEESSHILLVPIVAVWLAWIRRGRWRLCRPVGRFIGPLFLAAGWLLYSIGDTYLIQSFWHGGAVLIIIGCMLSVLGTDVLLQYLPVVLVLGFLIPIPALLRQQIALPLQGTTAEATHRLLELMGAEVGHAGNVLIINETEVAVAEACNGLRMVFALTLVSYAFAFGTPLRPYVRVLILVASPVSAIICNVIRLIPTVWLYGYYPLSVADSFHGFSGWIMLPIAFGALMGIIRLLRWALLPVTQYVLAYD